MGRSTREAFAQKEPVGEWGEKARFTVAGGRRGGGHHAMESAVSGKRRAEGKVNARCEGKDPDTQPGRRTRVVDRGTMPFSKKKNFICLL